jgi:hypothetical protein
MRSLNFDTCVGRGDYNEPKTKRDRRLKCRGAIRNALYALHPKYMVVPLLRCLVVLITQDPASQVPLNYDFSSLLYFFQYPHLWVEL